MGWPILDDGGLRTYLNKRGLAGETARGDEFDLGPDYVKAGMMIRQAIIGRRHGVGDDRKSPVNERWHRLGTTAALACCFALAASLVWSAPTSAASRGAPFSFADLVEKVIQKSLELIFRHRLLQ